MGSRDFVILNDIFLLRFYFFSMVFLVISKVDLNLLFFSCSKHFFRHTRASGFSVRVSIIKIFFVARWWGGFVSSYSKV